MAEKTIVHIIGRSVFLRYYLEFLKQNCSDIRHIFLIYGRDAHSGCVTYPEYEDIFTFVDICTTPSSMWLLNPMVILSHGLREKLNCADMIVAHALHFPTLELFLLYPMLSKKTFWIVWGEEFNFMYKKISSNLFIREFLRKSGYAILNYINKIVMSNIKYVAVQVTEYQKLKKMYNPFAIRVKMMLYYPYPFKPIVESNSHSDVVKILVGHSGWRGYGQLEVLDMLSKFVNEKIQLYIPLSYGNPEQISLIDQKAKLIFEKKAIILSKFMDPDEYNQLLSEIDVGVFNEPVQTGLGNIIALLGFGKKVYLRDDGQNKIIFDDMGYQTHYLSDIKSEDFSMFKYSDKTVSEFNRAIGKKRQDNDQILKEWNAVFSLYNSDGEVIMRQLGMIEENGFDNHD